MGDAEHVAALEAENAQLRTNLARVEKDRDDARNWSIGLAALIDKWAQAKAHLDAVEIDLKQWRSMCSE